LIESGLFDTLTAANLVVGSDLLLELACAARDFEAFCSCEIFAMHRVLYIVFGFFTFFLVVVHFVGALVHLHDVEDCVLNLGACFSKLVHRDPLTAEKPDPKGKIDPAHDGGGKPPASIPLTTATLPAALKDRPASAASAVGLRLMPEGRTVYLSGVRSCELYPPPFKPRESLEELLQRLGPLVTCQSKGTKYVCQFSSGRDVAGEAVRAGIACDDDGSYRQQQATAQENHCGAWSSRTPGVAGTCSQ
jgi:hypothetical protein